MNGHTLFIGGVAKQSRATVKAIRYYEQIGLIPKAIRQGKYRVYSDRMVQRIRFIKNSQALGFSLHEIRKILGAYDGGDIPCCEVAEIIGQKLPLIEQKINELQALYQELDDLKHQVSSQRQRDSSTICPVIHKRVPDGEA